MTPRTPARRHPPPWLLPAGILVAAFALRAVRLGDASVWWDEALAVWATRKGLLGVTLWTAADVHPPLYFWSLWGWAQLVGEGEYALRLLSAAYGVLTVAAVYALGTLVGGRRAGALAALLLALSRFHVWWSQEMRMYALAGLLGTLSLYCLLRWLRTERAGEDLRAARWLAGYALATLGALYTVFLMGALFAAQGPVVFAALAVPGYRRGRVLGGWAAAMAAVAAGVAGWLLLSWGRMRSWSVAEPMSPGLFARLYAVLLATGVSTDIDRLLPYAALPLAVLVAGLAVLVRGWWRRRERGQGPLEALALLLAWTVGAGAVYVATLPRGLFYTPRVEARYLVPFAPGFWVLVAWAAVELGRRWRAVGYGGAALLVALGVAFLPGHYADRRLRDDLQTMVRAIVSQAEPGDVVLLDSGSRYPIFDYHYRTAPAGDGAPPEVLLVPPDDREMTPEAIGALLPKQVAGAGRVWLAEVDVHLTDPERLARRWLEERYSTALAEAYGHNALYLFSADGRRPELSPAYTPQHPLHATTGDGGRLLGWELPVDRFHPGDVAHVSLLWERLPVGPVTVSLRDGQGRVAMVGRAAGEAGAAGAAGVRQQFDFPISRALPTGEYAIALSPAPEGEAALGALLVAASTAPPAPEPQGALGAVFEGGIVLEGYALSRPTGGRMAHLEPGDELVLDLYWRVEGAPGEDLMVFTHLLGEAYNPSTQGPVWGGHDARPMEGGCSTDLWRPGDRVVDRHIIPVDGEAPAGVYRLEVGLYRPADGGRLAVAGSGPAADHVLLPVELPLRR